MKIVSFNVNGLRARFHQLQALIDKHAPEIIGLQEIKVNDPDFPLQTIREMGYQVLYHGQKTHYGVALLAKQELQLVRNHFAEEASEHQRRLLVADYPLADGRNLRLLNGYFPQGENREHPTKFPHKRQFYANLKHWLEQDNSADDLLLVMGDVNVAPQDTDIGIGADNARRWLRSGKCAFLPEERKWLEQIKNWGLSDSFRAHYPDVDDRFSWFDYRSRGFDAEPKRGLRIDLILATAPMMKHCTGADIDYQIRAMEKPSDHCPIWAEFDLT